MALAGCSPTVAQPPTLGPEFAVGGPGLGDRCSSGSLPRPTGTVGAWCMVGVEARDMESPSGPGGSNAAVNVEPGRYWVV